MSQLPDDRAEGVFADFKPAYTSAQAAVEANRCLFCYDAPCIKACPTGIDIPQFIRKIATGNVQGSAGTIFDSNVLGMSCARVCPVEVLCVGDCVYNEMGVPPIQIGKLQRYSTDMAFEAGWQFFEAGPDTGRSIGIVGAGPAGLAAAHRLRRFGHAVTIYDKRDVVGGLNTTGVAPYKMKADRSVDEVAWVLAIGGIDVQLGVSVPGDVSWEALQDRHDALFLGFGLGPDSVLDLPGGDLDGIEGAVAFIERMKLSGVDLSGVRNALVIGGGNTAVDAVRELVGLGIENVTMVYRGTEAKMSGYAHEWMVAKQEGVRVVWQTQPVGYEGADSVTGVRCIRMDAAKNPIAGSEHIIAADLVLLAVGQAKLGDLVAGLDGVAVERGRIVTDAVGATGGAGVWAGGDCRNGGKEVVNGVAEGRDAAEAIHAHLTGGA
ncbi:MAG: dihydropyrimidine dehydrogenase (NAD+) subunit PreT [Myxococcota bacterium]|jgi:dihydropyrimidine dehydrogenase (NAD+) subunit PreT